LFAGGVEIGKKRKWFAIKAQEANLLPEVAVFIWGAFGFWSFLEKQKLPKATPNRI
jgi:hypothetical protein